MTKRAHYFGRCPTCGTEQPVSDWLDKGAESPGRYFLIHAEFNLKCEGSSGRCYGWWREGGRDDGNWQMAPTLIG